MAFRLGFGNNKSAMASKRSLSPSCTNDQLKKRLRVAVTPVNAYHLCLHCQSGFHKWVDCTNTCLHCNCVHAKKRCPVLGVDNYTPGGFSVRNPVMPVALQASQDYAVEGTDSGYASTHSAAQANAFLDGLTLCVPAKPSMPSLAEDHAMFESDLVHVKQEITAAPAWKQTVGAFSTLPIREPLASLAINPERAAMIAATPVAEAPNQEIGLVEGGGPLQSGITSMPLGTRKPTGTSQQPTTAASSLLSDRPQFSARLPPTVTKKATRRSKGNRIVKSTSFTLRSGTVVDRSKYTPNVAPAIAPATSYTASGSFTGPIQNHAIWQGLKSHIETAVRDAAVLDPSIKKGAQNNLHQALSALRPLILGRYVPAFDFKGGVALGPVSAPLDLDSDGEPVIKTE